VKREIDGGIMALFSSLFGQKDGWITVDDLKTALASETPPFVIDVRNPDEFTGPLGHIEGADNIPLPIFGGQVEQLASEARPVVLVCHTDRRSSAAAAQLRQAGNKQVSVLRGGMMAWRMGPGSA
jgi:rhodanese-related sulfurtransferase